MSGPRILLVDDHPVVCQGISLLLEGAGMTIGGMAAGVQEALELIPATRPEVVLVDLNLGADGDGLVLLETLAGFAAPPRRLVYSMREDALSIERALAAGALGYVTKVEVWDTLVAALQAVDRGQRFISPRARKALQVAAPPAEKGRQAPLSDRERETFRLLGEGFSVSEIAALLEISPRTVESYCGRLLVKLDVHGMRELRRLAIATRRRDERDDPTT